MKEVLLILGIIEGRGWKPIDGHKTFIEANLDNHRLSTEAFPLTSAPKFNTEITWEAEKQTIRSYKLNRLPIKIECYAVDGKNNRKLLGYIVLPLTSAVEGLEVDSKWHKLLGGPPTTFKSPPSLLLRLHLEAMTLDQRSGLSGKQLTAFRNGHVAEDDKMACILEGNRMLLDREGIEVRVIQTNGNQQGLIENSKQTPVPSVENSHVETANGVNDNLDDEMLDYNSCDDYPSEDNDDPNEMFGVIMDSFSLSHSENQNDKNGQLSNNDVQNKQVKLNLIIPESSKSVNDVQKETSNNPISTITKSSSAKSKTLSRNQSFKERTLDHDILLKTRLSTRKELQNISQNLLSPDYQNSPSLITPTTTCNQETEAASSSHEKRALEISQILSQSWQQRKKSQKVDTSFNCSHSPSLAKIENNEEAIKPSLLHPSSASSAAVLLFKHAKKQTSKVKDVKDSGTGCQKLIPHLNHEGGYFSIGPREGEKEDEFLFSVTIIYAKNLSKIISPEVIPNLKEGFHFCYSLLGYSIYTDPFHNLDEPEFLAEKASASIRSSHESLFQYFLEHYFLPVYLLSGEVCLGVCRVDLSQLLDIATQTGSKVEGVYEMTSIEAEQGCKDNDNPQTKAIVAFSIELSKTNKGSDCVKALSTAKLSKHVIQSCMEPNNSEVMLTDSMESESDSEEELGVKRILDGRRRLLSNSYGSRFTAKVDNLSYMEGERELKHKKKMMMLQAASEVEVWKEKQQKRFMDQMTAQEECLQKLIASEWSSKAKLIEGELSHRLNECDKLQDKLNLALTEVTLKEEKLKLREKRLSEVEQDFRMEKEKMESLKLVNGSPIKKETSNTQHQNLLRQLRLEEEKNVHLQKEISRLNEEVQNSEENVKAQMQEAISLRKELIQTNDVIGITKEKDALVNKIESLQERKQYYKAQWRSALIDLHKIHAAHKKTIDDICTEPKGPSPELLPTMNSDYYATACLKLRKLRDERKTLLNSGLYSPHHSIIQNIDEKIRELIGY